MRHALLAAAVAAGLGAACAGPALALGPAAPDGIAPAAPVTQVASAARERRIYMMQQAQRQQMYGYRYGYNPYRRPRAYGYGYPAPAPYPYYGPRW